MVERSLSMWEVRGSIPRVSKTFLDFLLICAFTHQYLTRVGESGMWGREDPVGTQKEFASSGNRTRAARVAGEHSTTEPTMLWWC